jgi:hypothetical protein
MKTYRFLIAVLSLPVVCIACLALSGCQKPAAEAPKELWHTNTVELWHTNTVENWRTNALEVVVTNTLVQVVTNEVTKEVPAKLSALEKRAGLVGYKQINAPSLASGSEALYKAGPFAVDVYARKGAAQLPGWDAQAVSKQIEDTLKSNNIPVAAASPAHLSLELTPVWATDVPRVALVMVRLELSEKVALDRQSDVVDCAGSVWSKAASKLIRTGGVSEDLKDAVQDQVDSFCRDFLKARDTEKAVQARILAVPDDFLSGGK